MGLVLLALIWALQAGLGQAGIMWFDVGFDGGRCVVDKGFFVCSGYPGAKLLTYAFLLPPAVFVGAPIALLAIANGALFSEIGKASFDLLAFGIVAILWFALGIAGSLRSIFFAG
jgi:hypothetical protein